MIEWRTTTLGALCSKVTSGGTPLRSVPEYYDGGTIPWLKTGEVKKNYVWLTEEHITVQGLEASSAKLIPTNSLIVAMYGDGNTAGNVAINKVPLATNQACCNFILNPEIANYQFVYHYLKGSYNNLVNLKVGGSQQNLNAATLKGFPIKLPSLLTQQKIAAILSAYDDLIANNQCRITLLERMAEEIYCEWFVRLRFPGHAHAVIEKAVPKGWAVYKFREIVEFYIGGGWGEDLQTATHSEEAYVIRGTDIPRLNAEKIQLDSSRFHTPSNLKSRLMQKGDLVFEVSGGSKDQLLGRNLLITEKLLRVHKNKLICASFCKMLRFNQKLVSPYAMKYFFKLYYETDLVGLYQVQSTGISNYQFEAFLNYQTVLLPPLDLQEKFDKHIVPILSLKDDLALQTAVLKSTRDSLLPRLIAGKLAVDALDIHYPPGMANTA